jgi:WD40 repeat protein
MHFFLLIQQSALHIYHSALPLSPRLSTFFPSIRYKDTLITSFDERPYTWGAVVRTIRRNPGSFTYNTTFGHRIAAACDNSMVVVYGSVTGMLELSLSPAEPVHAMGGSPDGSVLFCRHQGPSVTLWDIQTGGLIHTFVLRSAVVDIAISLKGRYLAYRLSDGSVKFSEIAYKTEGAAIRSGSQVANFCWMEPEEQLAVAEGMSVQIWDVASGEVLKRLTVGYPVFGMVHSQGSNQLVVVTRSGDDSAAKTISPLGGTSSAWYWTKRKLSHFTFSHATNELVCGAEVPTLELFDISTLRWRCFKHPAITGFVSPLPSGFVAASGVGPDIQMLSLDKKYTSQMATQETLSVPRVHPDEGKTIAVLRPGLSVILAKPTTTSVLLTVPSNELPRSRIFAGTLYLTLEDRTEFLQFWMSDGGEHLEFCDEASKGAMGVKGSSLDISPLEISRASLGIRLVTFHDAGHETRLCVRDAQNGQSQAEKSFKKFHLAQLLRLKFELKAFGKNSFIHFDHPHTPNVSCHRQQPLVVESPDGLYHVEDNMEWVVRGSKRVLWIPPGYVRSGQPSYCWTESTLIMYGQDGTLRMLRICS